MSSKLDALWDEFITPENFRRAAKNALRNKKKTPAIRRFMANADELTENLRMDVINGKFHTGNYAVKTIHEPKTRQIYILPFYPDRIVHHALMNVIAPIWDKMFIPDSYACRAGRGIHAASRRIMQFVRRRKYFLQCDIRKFYPSINHDTMYAIVRKSLHAGTAHSPLLDIIRDIIYSVPGGNNMPIGNLTSQWLGNLYMNELDRYVKDVMHVREYVRYCDDFVLFADDKAQLHTWRAQLQAFVAEHLHLTFSYAEIAPVSNGVDFCGYRHFPHTILLRRSTLRRIRRRIKKIDAIPLDLRGSDDHIRGQIASMHGWLKHCHAPIRAPKFIMKPKGDIK